MAITLLLLELFRVPEKQKLHRSRKPPTLKWLLLISSLECVFPKAAKMRGVSFDLFHNVGCVFTHALRSS